MYYVACLHKEIVPMQCLAAWTDMVISNELISGSIGRNIHGEFLTPGQGTLWYVVYYQWLPPHHSYMYISHDLSPGKCITTPDVLEFT